MATFLVTTAIDVVDPDDGKISLREAIALANENAGQDTVIFNIVAPPALLQVQLDSAIQITDSVIIDGADTTRLIAGAGERIFFFTGSGTSTLQNIILADGEAGATGGGAVMSVTDLVLDGVTITGSSTTGAGAHGGAVNVTGNLTVLNSVFQDNATTGDAAQGGAIYVTGNATIRDSAFSGNGTAGTLAQGGAVSVVSALTLSDSTFTGNFTTGSGSPGGAVAALSANVTGTEFEDNLTSGVNSPGGALRGTGGLVLETSRFTGNGTEGNDSAGGGVSAGGELSISSTDFDDNFTLGDRSFGGAAATNTGLAVAGSMLSGNSTAGANAGGGALFSALAAAFNSVVIDGNSTSGEGSEGGGLFARGNVLVEGSTFSDNATTGIGASGGGIAGEAPVQVFRSTISGNTTGGVDAPGGGLYAEGPLTVQSVTITGNATTGADSQGGGAYAQSILTLLSSTVSANSTAGEGSGGGGIFSGGTATVTNATFADNRTTGDNAAGGAFHALSVLNLFKSTISGNQTGGAESPGGALFFGQSWLYGDNIVLGNAATASAFGTQEVGSGEGATQTALGTNLIGPDSADADAVFAETFVLTGTIRAGQLADNGGDVATIALLDQGSNPAIDTGLSGLLNENARGLDLNGDGDLSDAITTDARGLGFPRDIDISGVGGGLGQSGDLGAIEVTTVNRPPIAVDDNRTIDEGSDAILIDILSNDRDPDEGDVITLVGIDTAGLIGTAELVGSLGTTLRYDPAGLFEGLGSGEASVQFVSYEIEDMNGGTATGQVSITITGLNDGPFATNDLVAIGADDPEVLVDVLANDTDADLTDVLVVQAINDAQTQGQVRIAPGGTGIFYAPGDAFADLLPGQSRIDTLTYTLSDGSGGSDSGVVTFTVTGTAGPNLPPVARDDAVGAERGQVVALDPLAANGSGADTDPNAGDVLSVASVGAAAKGRAFLTEEGEVLYRSDPGATGTDSFDYVLSDGRGGTDTGTVTVTLSDPAGAGLSVGEAQRVALLFEAGLDRNGNISESGLNFHIDAREAGLSEPALARQFIASSEFEAKYGDPAMLDDRTFVELLFRNTLDREGSEAGIDFWTGIAEREGVEDEDLLIIFANSFENIANSPEVLSLEEISPGTWAFG